MQTMNPKSLVTNHVLQINERFNKWNNLYGSQAKSPTMKNRRKEKFYIEYEKQDQINKSNRSQQAIQ